MTLKEKFEEIENLGRFSDNGFSSWSTSVLENQSKECEKIADEHAINFAKWLLNSHVSELTLKEFKKIHNI